MVNLGNDWDEILKPEFASEYYLKIRRFLIKEYSETTVYPKMQDIFNCFRLCPFDKLKVVILGQDPYHEEGQAMGLSFSVPNGVKLPPSLQNIYKEMADDLGINAPTTGDLTYLAKQGVLLLNTVLTVREGQANSHKNCGWETFTDNVIKTVSDKKENVVFILWGGNARAKKTLIDTKKHFIVESAHPSPLSAYYGFFKSKPFSKTNNYLKSVNKEPVDWVNIQGNL